MLENMTGPINLINQLTQLTKKALALRGQRSRSAIKIKLLHN